ncbi:universal stress protein [Chloroflexota bacterium]
MATTMNKGTLVPQTSFSDKESRIQVTKTATKTERILIYMDDPWRVEHALSYIEDYTSRLAPEVIIEIYFLHIIMEMTHYSIGDGTVTIIPNTDEEIEQIMNKTMDYLNHNAESLRNKGIKVVLKVRIKTDAAKEIVKTAKEVNADLIVMFINKRSWLSRLAFSSLHDKVLHREKNVQVMLVRAEHLINQLGNNWDARN